MGKYFNVEVRPVIDVAALAAGNIVTSEVLFDWAGFDVPKGACKLVGGTILYRGKNGADYAATDFEVIYAKGNSDATAPTTLGDDGDGVDTPGWMHLIQGRSYVDASIHSSDGDLVYGVLYHLNANGGGANAAANHFVSDGLVLQGVPNSGTNVGYDKLYVAGIAKGTHNWGASTMEAGAGLSTSSPTVALTDLDATIALCPGDILRDEDNKLIGTVKTVDSATSITLEDNANFASAEGKLVYNTTPITFVLGFEK